MRCGHISFTVYPNHDDGHVDDWVQNARPTKTIHSLFRCGGEGTSVVLERDTTAQRNLNSWSCTQPARQEIATHHLLLDLMSTTGTSLGPWDFNTKILQPNSVKSHVRNGSTAVRWLWPAVKLNLPEIRHRPSRCPVQLHTSRWSGTGALQRQPRSDTRRFLNHRLGHLSADVGGRLVHLNGNPGSRTRHKCARPNHHTCRWFCMHKIL